LSALLEFQIDFAHWREVEVFLKCPRWRRLPVFNDWTKARLAVGRISSDTEGGQG